MSSNNPKKVSPPENFKDSRLVQLHAQLKRMNKSRRWLGRELGIGETTPQKWFDRDSWPDREEERIEKLCGFPSGFFAKIGAGQSYEEALSVTSDKQEVTIPVEELYKLRTDIVNVARTAVERLMRDRGLLPPETSTKGDSEDSVSRERPKVGS